MVPLSHLDDREQLPAPESLEVRHRALGPPTCLVIFRANQEDMGGTVFAEVVHVVGA